jgi:hypothetical protein
VLITNYYQGDQIKGCLRNNGHVSRIVEKKNAYKILVEPPEGKKPHRKAGRIIEDNIKVERKGKSVTTSIGFVWLRRG